MVPDPWASGSHLTPRNILEIQQLEQADGLEEVSQCCWQPTLRLSNTLLLLVGHVHRPLNYRAGVSQGTGSWKMLDGREGLVGSVVAWWP